MCCSCNQPSISALYFNLFCAAKTATRIETNIALNLVVLICADMSSGRGNNVMTPMNFKQLKIGIMVLLVFVLGYELGLNSAIQHKTIFNIKDISTFGYSSTASHYPGRFKNTTYRNMTINIEFKPIRKNRAPYTDTGCADGLKCSFSDATWHEASWHGCLADFTNARAEPHTVKISKESPGHPNHKILQRKDETAGLATTYLESDVPLAYDRIETILKPKSETIKHWRVLHMASNCNSVQSDRNSLVEKLMKAGLLDSYGKCSHNADYNGTLQPLPERNQGSQLRKEYAFVTAFENSYYPGYITEKLWLPLQMGTLPIYLGAPNVKSLFPSMSFIDVNDFISHEDLIDYILHLINNRDDYDLHHLWRNKPLPDELLEIWRFTNQNENCRLCRWGAENLY